MVSDISNRWRLSGNVMKTGLVSELEKGQADGSLDQSRVEI